MSKPESINTDMFFSHVSFTAQIFIFQAPYYDTIEETNGAANTDSTTVMISRSGTAEETAVSGFVSKFIICKST